MRNKIMTAFAVLRPLQNRRVILAVAIGVAFGETALADDAGSHFDTVLPSSLVGDGLNPGALAAKRDSVDYGANAAVGGIAVDVANNDLPADGQSATRVTVHLVDKLGKPLTGDAFTTIEVSAGRVLLDGAKTDEMGPGRADADKTTPGVQLVVHNGTASFTLLAPSTPQDVRLRVTAGAEEAAGLITYLPELRQWIAAGLVEGIIALGNKAPNAIQPTRFDDGFESEIRQFQRTFNGDKDTVGVRAAVFLKGKIQGDYLLTLAYDSDKDTRNRLVGNVNPDNFYPVYGDSSLHGQDAQSTDKLYVRVDNGKSFLLYGNFSTSSTPASQVGADGTQTLRVRDLGDYQRNVLGAKWHYETPSVVSNLFANRDTLTQVVEEFRGQGISGPFGVSNTNAVAGSESVAVIVRDRNQPSLILSTTPLAALVDYTFDPFSGEILLKQPLPTYDGNLNPVSLRISYELDQGGQAFWLFGGDAEVKLGQHAQVGVSAIEDKNPLAPYKLESANTVIQLGSHTTMVAEVARSESTVNTGNGIDTATTPGLSGLSGNVFGNAWRLQIQHKDDDLDAKLYAGRSDPTFNNPTSSLNGGREELDARANYKLTDSWSLFGEAQSSEDKTTGGIRHAGEAGASYKVSEQLTVNVGLKRIEQNASAAQPSLTSYAGTTPTGAGGFFGVGNVAVDPVTGNPVVNQGSVFPTTGGAANNAGVDATTVRVDARYKATDRLDFTAGVEHDVSGDSKGMVDAGVKYRIAERTSLYARYEDQQGLSSDFSATPADKSRILVAGAETDYMHGGQIFSEYRLRDAESDADASHDVALASGVRNTFEVAQGLRYTTSLERLQALAGTGPDSAAVAAGVDYTANPLWKASAKLEYRRVFDNPTTPQNESADTWLSTLSYARKLDRDWTILARNYYLLDQQAALPGNHTQDRAQLGLAYRDTDTNRLDLLCKYEYKVDNNQEIAPAADTRAHILSFLGNYHPARPWWIEGRLAAEWSHDNNAGSYDAYLMGGRVIYDITKKIDIGVLANVLYSPSGNARQYAQGMEVGYNLAQNLWLSGGYIWKGFSNHDLTGEDYTNGGFFIRLRWKFDENLFAGDNPQVNRTLTP